MKTGVVIKTTGSWHTVRDHHKIVLCRLKGSFRKQGIRNTNPVAVGDQVEYDLSPDGNGLITRIAKRKNYIIRKATNLSRETQIMAANVDQAVLIFTLDFPETPLEFVDRFLVSAEAYHIPSLLLINKTDLYSGERLQRLKEIEKLYAYAGYTVIATSVLNNQHIDQVKELLTGKTSLVAGNSGVGKSSLINRLRPGLNLKTADISWYHESGRHTTTYPEMIELWENTYIIDSPGIRGFGITDMARNEIGLYFTDIFRLSKDCQFYNCTHTHEPNCAVIEAVKNGILHESRYRSYINIFTESGQKYRTS